MNIQISNLNTSIDNEALKELFTPFGVVKTAKVEKDAFTNTSRGFGFIEMENDSDSQNAINSLNNTVVKDLTITVEESKPKTIHRGSYKVGGNGPVEVYRFNKKNK
jgi:RNA recognition motif-containing protein